jgi:hypothetical protein
MNDKAWEDLIDLIDSQYAIDKTERAELPLEDEPKLKKTVESIHFEKDNTKFKIERVTGPRVIDKKTFYSGQGVANHAKYIYDPSETSSKVLFYRQLPDGNFNEISPEDLMATS